MKTTTIAYALALSAALLATPAFAIGPIGGGPAAPAPAPSPPSPSDRDPSAQRTNYSFALDGIARKTMNPGFCQRNAGDYYVKTSKTECENY